MKLGVVGAGFIGRAVAALGLRAGYEVMISNSRHPRTLGSTVVALGCQAGTATDAAWFGDVVVLAVPFYAVPDLAPEPFAAKPVLDATNYYPQRDGLHERLDRFETTTSESVAAHLPGAEVVKAFNAILQNDLALGGTPPGAPGRRALPLASDHPGAKAVAAGIYDAFGYDAVDAGPLAEGWRFERAMPAYCVPLDADALRAALAGARRGVEVPHGSWRG